MNIDQRCKNKINLKLKELRSDYWELFHKIPNKNEIDNAMLFLVNTHIC